MRAGRASLAGCERYHHLAAELSCDMTQLNLYGAYLDAHTPALLVQPMSAEAMTHEIVWSGQWGRAFDNSPVDWHLGVFYEDRRDTAEGRVLAADAASGERRFPDAIVGQRELRHRLLHRAYFGEATLQLVSDTQLTLGMRAYRYDKTGEARVNVSNYVSGLLAPESATGGVEEQGGIYKISISRKLSSDLLTYVQAAQGFRPGGLNFNPNIPEDYIRYDADDLWNFEWGFKSLSFDDRLGVNIALYHIDWRDMQYAALTANRGSRFLVNVGRVLSDGFELDVALQWTDSFSANWNFVYTNARVVEVGSGTPGLFAQPGDRVPIVPRYASNLAVRYRQRLGDAWHIDWRSDVGYSDGAYSEFNATSREYARIDPSALVNLRATLSPSPAGIDAAWRVSGFVTNLFDRTDATQVLTNLSGPVQASGPAPRTVGFSLEYRFD
jgi:iron complex outermembrane recepter protein